jgi:hypothetical protein
MTCRFSAGCFALFFSFSTKRLFSPNLNENSGSALCQPGKTNNNKLDIHARNMSSRIDNSATSRIDQDKFGNKRVVLIDSVMGLLLQNSQQNLIEQPIGHYSFQKKGKIWKHYIMAQ